MALGGDAAFVEDQNLVGFDDGADALGDDEAIKYSLSPCADNPSQQLNSSDLDELRNELIRHVGHDSKISCFELQVQPLEPSRMTHGPFKKQEPAHWWVENAESEWKEDQAPFYSVGKLTLKAESIVDDAVCEARWISVTKNNSVIHHGLGSLNRARNAAETASANVRLN